MSPFSSFLSEIRKVYDLHQRELAEMMGYEQSYLSALECGSKGPPTQEFADKLTKVLELTDGEKVALTEAIEYSQRKVAISTDAPRNLYIVLNELRLRGANLHPAQMDAIIGIMKITDKMAGDDRQERIKRVRNRKVNPVQVLGEKPDE